MSRGPSKRLDERSDWELRGWLIGFPIVGATLIGMILRTAIDQAATMTISRGVWTSFIVLLGLFAVVMPPIIAWRELRRRRLDKEDALQSAAKDGRQEAKQSGFSDPE